MRIRAGWMQTDGMWVEMKRELRVGHGNGSMHWNERVMHGVNGRRVLPTLGDEWEVFGLPSEAAGQSGHAGGLLGP